MNLAKTSVGKAAEVESLIAPTLRSMGYDIVRIVLSGRDQPVLQIMAERLSDGGMTVDDCAEVSRAVAAILDVEDPIPSAYTLEVSSPGLDRPLTRLADFERFAGFEAKVEMTETLEGRRRFAGRLRGVEQDQVLIQCDEGETRLPFLEIAKAKLKLTDELIAASETLRQSNPSDD
ncbi:MAG: ribosome maturation factor RimP [Pseudomonadota bacterium]